MEEGGRCWNGFHSLPDTEWNQKAYSLEVREIKAQERPPMMTIPEYQMRLGENPANRNIDISLTATTQRNQPPVRLFVITDLDGTLLDQQTYSAVFMLIDLYGRSGTPAFSVGLGNSATDVPLLNQEDRPVVVRNPDGGWDVQMLKEVPTARRTEGIGPKGWNEAAQNILNIWDLMVLSSV